MDLGQVSGKKYRVLLVDSNGKSYFHNLVGFLKNCLIILMPDYAKAKEFFSQNPVDLVLFDHPDRETCLQMLQFFKSVKPSIPAVVLAAQGSEDFTGEVFRYGAQDYFPKPLRLDEFAIRIQAILALQEASERDEPKTPIEELRRGVRYIQESHHTALKLPQVAREAGMSVSSFARKFKKQMGMTFTDYVNRLRITQAATMLIKEDLSMSDIAFACGYNNQFHFTRMFKRIMKTSPTSYRRLLKD